MSSSFGINQGQSSPRLTTVYKHDDPDNLIKNIINITEGIVSTPVQSGFYVSSSVSKDMMAVKFLVSNVETRPVNTAIRIWVRI